ncbi:efflux RND transporter periplasmic adaptor subunit [Stieleria sp. JC731]|uniref:efflux RND transporter periplasmic adaptor subunit n=1 Tax=Pirellulaceae TaxID=2691357 RepID=UPI001E653C16|nr:HlyD family efflux transporter periplasmic adaptor subunit [Stieleria sp. JC731]MCC9602018.1 efflux RND transporter periplasmic adaptor subunit [Stieleria sp. JC731]
MDRPPNPPTNDSDEGYSSPSRDREDSQTTPSVSETEQAPAESSGRSKSTRFDQWLLFNVAIPVLLLLVGVFIFKMLGVAKAKPLPPPETTEAAVLESLPVVVTEPIESLEATGQQLELVIDGTVVPFQEAQISAEVAGRILFKSETCEAGQRVRKGDLLMRIDSTDYQLDVERLTRQREQEYRALGEVDQEIINTQKSMDVARQEVRLQQQEVERQKRLSQFGSQSELDRAKSALLSATQQLLTYENSVETLRRRRSKLEASEQLAATQLKVAEVNLQRCNVSAPIDGVIVSEQADVNNFVNRGTPLVTIENVSKSEVIANMRMDQLHWVIDQKNAEAEETDSSLSAYDLPDTDAIIEYSVAGREGSTQRWQGKLVSYDGVGIDPNTRTVPVRIVVEDPTRYIDQDGQQHTANHTTSLLRGMFVSVRLQLQPKADLVVIPARALRPGNRVWKFRPDPQVLADAIEQAKKAAEKANESAEGTTEPPSASEEVDSDAEESEVDSEPFDPAKWTAGLVAYSQTVFPIESLRLSDKKESDPNLAPSLQTAERYWVCEAERSDLANGDFVVVSPLDSIPPAGLPARAELKK